MTYLELLATFGLALVFAGITIAAIFAWVEIVEARWPRTHAVAPVFLILLVLAVVSAIYGLVMATGGKA